MTTLGHSLIQIVQQLQDISLEGLSSGHAIERLRTDIVANKFQKHKEGVIFFLVPGQSFDIAPGIARISTIDGNILIIVVIAEVPLTQIFVDGMSHITRGVCVASVSRLVGDVQLVGHAGEQIIVSAFLDHGRVEVFFRDGEVGASRVADYGQTQPGRFGTKIVFVSLEGLGVHSIDPVAIFVQDVRALLPAWVDLLGELIAVGTPPVVPSESRNVREGIVVKVKRRQMTVSKLIHKDVGQPLPRRRPLPPILQHLDLFISNILRTDAAGRVLTEPNIQASSISTLFLQDSLDNGWSSIMHEGLASRLNNPIEELAELLLHKVSHISLMDRNVVLHDLGDNHTERTLIIEATNHPKSGVPLQWPVSQLEVHVGALLTELFQSGIDLFELVNPPLLGAPVCNLQQQTDTRYPVTVGEAGACVAGLRDAEVSLESED